MKKLLTLLFCLIAFSAQGQVRISNLPTLGSPSNVKATFLIPGSDTTVSTTGSYVLSLASASAYVLALNGSADTNLSRVSAGVVGVGTGAAASVAGTLKAATVTVGGSNVTESGSTLYLQPANQVLAVQGSITAGSDSIGNANLIFNTGTNISRSAAGVIAVGTGAAASTAGAMVAAWYGIAPPTVVSGGSYTVATTDAYVINSGGTQTLTLPSASGSNKGRVLDVSTRGAFAVNSASSNVVPMTSGTAGTAILAATAGKWATLVSDGTNWIIMRSN